MNCQKAKEWISEGMDRTLDGPDAVSLEEHLATCPDCRRFREGMTGVAAAFSALPSVSAPPELMRRLELAPRSRIPRWLPVAAAALILVGGISAYHRITTRATTQLSQEPSEVESLYTWLTATEDANEEFW